MAASTLFRNARRELALARLALTRWGTRQYAIAAVSAVLFGVLVGFSTVLIPNQFFSREIETIWWNYPVWIVTAIGAGMLVASYVSVADEGTEREAKRSARMGVAGGLLTWFAVGCPVCNKIALIVLGYSGALTWFAPLQPILAISALLLTGVALVWRLRGQVACRIAA